MESREGKIASLKHFHSSHPGVPCAPPKLSRSGLPWPKLPESSRKFFSYQLATG